MNDNSDAYYNQDYTEEDVIKYYTDQGYTYNEDTGKVETSEKDDEKTGDPVQVEAPKDLQQITNNDIVDGVNYDVTDS